MNEALLKAIYDNEGFADKGIPFEKFVRDMETPELQQAVFDNAGFAQKGISFEKFQNDLAIPLNAQVEPVDESFGGVARRAYEKGLIQADLAGLGTDILVDGEISDDNVKALIDAQRSMDKMPIDEDYVNFTQSKGIGEGLKNFAKAPLKIATELAVESLTSFIKLGKEELVSGVLANMAVGSALGPGGAAVAGAVGAVVGVGATSFQLEGGLDIIGSIQEEMNERGLDANNAEDWRTMLNDEEFITSARRRAATKGGVVAVFDAVTGGIAGKIAKGSGKILAKGVKSLAAESVGGGVGDAASSFAVGDEITGGSVLSEMIGEIGPGSVTIATQVVADPTRKLVRKAIRGKHQNWAETKIDDALVDIAMSNDPNINEKLESEINSGLELNQITEEEAEILRVKVKDLSTMNESIPEDVANRSRRKSILGFVQRRKALDEKIEGLTSKPVDEAFQEENEAEIEEAKREKEELNNRIKKEANPPSETITDEEFDDFTTAGNVSDETIEQIARKEKNGEVLTDRELEIKDEYGQEIREVGFTLEDEVPQGPDFVDEEILQGKTVTLDVFNADTGEKTTVENIDAAEAQASIRSMSEKLNKLKRSGCL